MLHRKRRSCRGRAPSPITPHEVVTVEDSSDKDDRIATQNSDNNEPVASNSKDDDKHRDNAQHTLSTSQNGKKNDEQSTSNVGKSHSMKSQHALVWFLPFLVQPVASNSKDDDKHRDNAQHTLSTSQNGKKNDEQSTSNVGKSHSMKSQHALIKRCASPITLDSDDDEHYYSNKHQRQVKKVARNKPSKRIKMNMSDAHQYDDSLSDTSTEREPPASERIRIRVETQNAEQKEIMDKVAEEIRARALVYSTEPCTSNIFVNPILEETIKALRVIHALERKKNTVTPAIFDSRPHTKAKEEKKPQFGGDIVYVTVQDFVIPRRKAQTYSWAMDETFERLKETMAEIWDVDPSCVGLEEAGTFKRIFNGNSPNNLKYEPFQSVRFNAMISGEKIMRIKKDPSMIELLCRTENNHRPKKIEVDRGTPFVEIKERIMKLLGITSISRIIFDDARVSDDSTPLSLDMENDSVLDVYP